MKLIYDVTILGTLNEKDRSGIYYVALNVLQELLKREDLDLVLYCDTKNFVSLEEELARLYPNEKFKLLTSIKNTKLIKLHSNLYAYKKEIRHSGQKWNKFLVQAQLLFLSTLLKLDFFLSHINKKKYSDYDIFFSPMHKFPEKFSKIKSLNRYLILYDTIPLIRDDYSLTGWFKDVVKSLKKEDYYFAISDSARNDFLKYCEKIDPKKIKTTLLACNDNFRMCNNEQIEFVKKKYGIPEDKKYIFSLCRLEPRKNLIRSVKTFVQFLKKNNIEDLLFALGGPQAGKFIEVFEKEMVNLDDYKDKILKIGYVDDGDLASLYSGAEWFTFTSQYEGFGLPPLEAMSCGCPVIASNNSSLPEVVGDAAIMIDWDSDEQHIEAYEKYYFNEDLRKDYAQKGLTRARQFSWKKCVDEMVGFMKEVQDEV